MRRFRLFASISGMALMAAVLSVPSLSASAPWQRSTRCLRAHGEKLERPPARVLRHGFHPAYAYFVDFNDPQWHVVGGVRVKQPASAFVVYATSRGAVPKLERAYIASIGMVGVPLWRFHFEEHDLAFIQWNPAPLARSTDRRVVTLCLGLG